VLVVFIFSDDLFSLPYCPGKTLAIGASYVSLECAGFLRGLGLDVTVMVRSILLRGFDQQMAESIGNYMAATGINFIRPCVPIKIEKIEDGVPALYRVTGQMDDGTEVVGEYNTILMAVGRDPCTAGLHLERVGVKVNQSNGYVICGDDDSTSCPYIYAIGDIVEGRPELTPVAIQAGQLLVRRLFNGGTLKCDYTNVPTTVFTPLEYGCIGLTEEAALAQYGENDVEVYHSNFLPLEWTLPHHNENTCYAKLICIISQNHRVVGFHVAGPNAGEITQGWTLALKLGATKADFDNAIGIHPTCAEIFTTLKVTKRSGENSAQKGC
jgi:thioredoxin/glutathione reductase (selenoprotein)